MPLIFGGITPPVQRPQPVPGGNILTRIHAPLPSLRQADGARLLKSNYAAAEVGMIPLSLIPSITTPQAAEPRQEALPIN